MGERLAKLLLLTTTTTFGGCSLIYGPDRLPAVNDAPPDSPTPVKGCELALESVSPAELLEGQGEGGSRPPVVVVKGSNIAPDAKITISRHESETIMPSLEIDPAQNVVDKFGVRVAVPVKVNVDADIGTPAKGSLRLVVTVTQQCPDTGMPVSVTLKELEGGAPVLTLRGFGELTDASGALPASTSPLVYSRVDVTSLDLTGRTTPVFIRSNSSITIGGTGPLRLNADGPSPGPGGFAGGAGGEPGVLGGAGDGKIGGGSGGGRPNGGGAGFAQMGDPGTGAAGPAAGDAPITSLVAADSPNRGSGGAGGRGGPLVGNPAGGAGGGGGGALELTAGGDLLVSVPIEAKGSSGGGGANGATPGGGGSGGVVLLRAGRNLTVGNMTAGVTVTGGGRGGGTGAAGAGSVGRVRVDAPERTLTLMSTPEIGYRGPMFTTATPLIVREAQPRITLIAQSNAVIQYTLDNGNDTIGPNSFTVPMSGEATIPFSAPLFEGYNRLCVLVTGVSTRRDEAENCITLTYLLPEG